MGREGLWRGGVAFVLYNNDNSLSFYVDRPASIDRPDLQYIPYYNRLLVLLPIECCA